jgi:hypothetical protein
VALLVNCDWSGANVRANEKHETYNRPLGVSEMGILIMHITTECLQSVLLTMHKTSVIHTE